MRLTIEKEGTFVPAFRGNHQAPAADQITVRYKTPTVAMKNRCRKKPQAKGIAAANGSIDRMEIIIEKDEIAALTEMLVSISNCSYSGGDGRDTVIAGAQDLINAPVDFEPLLKEIVGEFDRILDHAGVDEKN